MTAKKYSGIHRIELAEAQNLACLIEGKRKKALLEKTK